jgi:hypothetical protein
VVLLLVAIAAMVSVSAQTLPKPEVLSKTGNTPLSEQTVKDRREFIAQCKANNGIPVPVLGLVGSDGMDCAAKLGE